MAFARLLFPTEAGLAMEMADDHITAKYAGLSGSKGSSGNLREVDLNETPSRRTQRLQVKLQALMKTGTHDSINNLRHFDSQFKLLRFKHSTSEFEKS